MRVIKLGIISIIFFFLLITAFSLFIPSRIRISRAMNTGVVADSLFENYIADLANWKHWYPGLDSVPLAGIATKDGKMISGKAGNTGISLTNSGDTLIEINYSTAGNKPVHEAFRQMRHPLHDSITIQWYMDFRLRWYPWEKFSGLMFEKRYGSRMEQGLSNLKKLVSK